MASRWQPWLCAPHLSAPQAAILGRRVLSSSSSESSRTCSTRIATWEETEVCKEDLSSGPVPPGRGTPPARLPPPRRQPWATGRLWLREATPVACVEEEASRCRPAAEFAIELFGPVDVVEPSDFYLVELVMPISLIELFDPVGLVVVSARRPGASRCRSPTMASLSSCCIGAPGGNPGAPWRSPSGSNSTDSSSSATSTSSDFRAQRR